MALWKHGDGAQEDRKRDIEQALAQWKEAERYFQSVQETDLMDLPSTKWRRPGVNTCCYCAGIARRRLP